MTRTLVSLLPSDLARTRGGAERYAIELHRALAEALPGWRTRGLVAATSEPERHVPDGWSAVGGPFADRLWVGDAIGAATTLRHALPGVDVVICHGWRTRAAAALRLATRFKRSTVLVGMDHGAGTRMGYVLSWLPLGRAGLGAHQSTFEAGVSPIAGRAHAVIRGGVDPARFSPGAAAAGTDFLMVGRFLPYKGQLRFLEQLPEGASARLIGPSDSTDPAYLDAVLDRAAAVGATVEFDLGDAELVTAYRDARHTVQVPIDFRRFDGAAPPELLGLTMLEAMACGSVPICPGTGASAEFVEHDRTGLTYTAGDARALQVALRSAVAAPQHHARLRQAALTEAEGWTWPAAARQLVAALRLG